MNIVTINNDAFVSGSTHSIWIMPVTMNQLADSLGWAIPAIIYRSWHFSIACLVPTNSSKQVNLRTNPGMRLSIVSDNRQGLLRENASNRLAECKNSPSCIRWPWPSYVPKFRNRVFLTWFTEAFFNLGDTSAIQRWDLMMRLRGIWHVVGFGIVFGLELGRVSVEYANNGEYRDRISKWTDDVAITMIDCKI